MLKWEKIGSQGRMTAVACDGQFLRAGASARYMQAYAAGDKVSILRSVLIPIIVALVVLSNHAKSDYLKKIFMAK